MAAYSMIIFVFFVVLKEMIIDKKFLWFSVWIEIILGEMMPKKIITCIHLYCKIKKLTSLGSLTLPFIKIYYKQSNAASNLPASKKNM